MPQNFDYFCSAKFNECSCGILFNRSVDPFKREKYDGSVSFEKPSAMLRLIAVFSKTYEIFQRQSSIWFPPGIHKNDESKSFRTVKWEASSFTSRGFVDPCWNIPFTSCRHGKKCLQTCGSQRHRRKQICALPTHPHLSRSVTLTDIFRYAFFLIKIWFVTLESWVPRWLSTCPCSVSSPANVSKWNWGKSRETKISS